MENHTRFIYHQSIVKSISIFLQTLVSLVLLAGLSYGQLRPIVFQNALIIDGTGKPSYRSSVRIAGGKIVKIGKIKPSKDDEVVDANGLVLAPGFIDIHNHSEAGLLREGTAANQ